MQLNYTSELKYKLKQVNIESRFHIGQKHQSPWRNVLCLFVPALLLPDCTFLLFIQCHLTYLMRGILTHPFSVELNGEDCHITITFK